MIQCIYKVVTIKKKKSDSSLSQQNLCCALFGFAWQQAWNAMESLTKVSFNFIYGYFPQRPAVTVFHIDYMGDASYCSGLGLLLPLCWGRVVEEEWVAQVLVLSYQNTFKYFFSIRPRHRRSCIVSELHQPPYARQPQYHPVLLHRFIGHKPFWYFK